MATLSYVFQVQQTGYWCGPAATRVALSARITRPPSQLTLAAALGTTVNGTDSSADVVRVLNAYLGAGQYEVRAGTVPVTTLIGDIVAGIDAGFAVVANVAGSITPIGGKPKSYPGGHYVAVVGHRASGTEVMVADIAIADGEYWVRTADLSQWIVNRAYSRPVVKLAPSTDLRPKRSAGMFRLIDPDGGQFVVFPEALSPTGWAYDEITDPVGEKGWMIAASGMGTANGNPKDPAHDPNATPNWRPGAFGPTAAAVRSQFITDLAAKVVASLPSGGGGGQGGAGITVEQVAAAVRAELDKTKLGH